MKEPEKIPLDPSTPRAKSVKTIRLFPVVKSNDLLLDKDKINNEDSKKSTET